MARFNGAFLAFIPARRRRRIALLLLTPHSWCRFSAQRSSISEVTARAHGDRDCSGPVARFGIWKRTGTKGMAGLLLDLSDPDDQCADLRLPRYRRRQIERDQDDTRMAWPPPNLWITDAFVSGSGVCQCRTFLASLSRSHHAGSFDTRLRHFALVIEMAGAPGSLESASGQSVVPAGDRGMVEIGRGFVRAGGFSYCPVYDDTPMNDWPSESRCRNCKKGHSRARAVGRAVRPEIMGGEVTGHGNAESPGSGGASPYLRRDFLSTTTRVTSQISRPRDCGQLTGGWYFLRDLHRMWNCTCHEPEAVYRTLGFTRQGNDK
jgi:hypothetical protein